jgi:hypothetical protein
LNIIIVMKGLSLTLTIVIVAIVLLVTALVIMTIFGGQIAQFIGILNPWSEAMLKQSLCNQKCAAYCQGHVGIDRPVLWSEIPNIDAQSEPKDCQTIMAGISDNCICRGIPVAGGCTLKCEVADAGKQKTGASASCPEGKTCTVTCPAGIAEGGVTVSGTCK